MTRSTSFRDRVAVVTGAASGIGRALAQALSGDGATVALVDLDAEGLCETARTLATPCSTHRVDVGDRRAMAALPSAVLEAHGRVHLLVNNAGVATVGAVFEQDLDEYDRLWRVNVLGVVHGCTFFARALCDSRPAWIVNNASILGVLGVAGRAAYCASKFAVRGFSESLAQELAGTGIGVTTVYAGAVDTNIIASATYPDARVRERFVAHFRRHGIAPAAAAQQILRAVRRGRDRVYVGRDARFIQRLKRLAPRRADGWLNALAERQMDLGPLRQEALRRFLSGPDGERAAGARPPNGPSAGA